jgi:hypothetical protein
MMQKMEQQRTPYFPLGGGLDLVTPAIAMKAGYAIAAKNYEPVLGGYRRINGFERFDGRTSPTDAPIWQLDFETGTATIAAGATVTGATSGATGVALSAAVVLTGSYGAGNATGYVGLGAVVGTFVDGENLQVGGVTKCVAVGTAEEDFSPDDDTANVWYAAATANARALIAAVPGSGPVRGVWSYNGERYAFRDNVGATAGVMFRATAAGWVAVTMSRRVSFTSGGVAELEEGDTVVGATSGATAVVARVFLESGTWAAGTAAGYLLLNTQTGTFQAENLDAPAVQMNIATIAANSTVLTLPPGGRYDFVNHNFYGASSLYRMYSVNGVGPAFEFDGATFSPISTGMPVDTPSRIAVHRQALFLAFPGGSVQFSEPGEPHVFNVVLGAGEIGIGSEVMDFIANTKTSLVILGETTINVLYGSDSSDYNMETLTDESGAFAWTADKVGQSIYMDKGGLRAVTATQSYGNFALGSLSRRIQKLVQAYVKNGIMPTGACRLRTKDQYRIFFSDNTAWAMHMGAKSPEIMTLDLGRLVTCISSVETDESEDIFFGSDDGFVYHLDKGNSFDGEEIEFFLRLPFNHLGSPQQAKRFHKISCECEASPGTEITVACDFDYGIGEDLGSGDITLSVFGGGGFWDTVNWNEFFWSSPVAGLAEAYLAGVGKNMSLLITGSSATQPPHTLQGMTFFYTPRGLKR